MALRVFIPMPQGGSRKGGTFGAWFSELAKKELGVMRGLVLQACDPQERGRTVYG